VPYISRAEREAERWMTWSELLAHVKNAEACEEPEARRQIQLLADDGALRHRWEHWRPPSGGTRGVTVPQGTLYFRTPEYWRTCAVDPADPDRVLEPPIYDPKMVDRRTAKRLEKARQYRKPLFERECVLKIWPAPSRPASRQRRPTDKHVKEVVAGYIADCKANGRQPTLKNLEEQNRTSSRPIERSRLRAVARKQFEAESYPVKRGCSLKNRARKSP
jgi:hypothetical protein